MSSPANVPFASSIVPQNAPLLCLPRELRDLIFSNLADYTQQIPQGGANYSRWLKVRMAPKESGGVTFDVLPYEDIRDAWPKLHKAVDLLLVCRQMHQDVSEFMTSSQTSSNRGQIDVVIRGYRWLPTWTSVPVLQSTTRPIDLTVKLRIQSGEMFYKPGVVTADCSAFYALHSLIYPLCRRQRSLHKLQARGQTPALGRLTFEMCCYDQYTPATFPMIEREFIHQAISLSTAEKYRTVLSSECLIVRRDAPSDELGQATVVWTQEQDDNPQLSHMTRHPNANHRS